MELPSKELNNLLSIILLNTAKRYYVHFTTASSNQNQYLEQRVESLEGDLVQVNERAELLKSSGEVSDGARKILELQSHIAEVSLLYECSQHETEDLKKELEKVKKRLENAKEKLQNAKTQLKKNEKVSRRLSWAKR
eukprot:405543_1